MTYRLLLLAVLLLCWTSIAQATLTLGVAPSAGASAWSQGKAEALAKYLQRRVGEKVEVRAFKEEKILYEWMDRYRMVDLAVLSTDFVRQQRAGAFFPLAAADAAPLQVVMRQGTGADLRNKCGQALVSMNGDPDGRQLLKDLGLTGFSSPKGVWAGASGQKSARGSQRVASGPAKSKSVFSPPVQKSSPRPSQPVASPDPKTASPPPAPYRATASVGRGRSAAEADKRSPLAVAPPGGATSGRGGLNVGIIGEGATLTGQPSTAAVPSRPPLPSPGAVSRLKPAPPVIPPSVPPAPKPQAVAEAPESAAPERVARLVPTPPAARVPLKSAPPVSRPPSPLDEVSPESEPVFIVPFTTVMVPATFSESVFDQFIETLTAEGEKKGYEFVILKEGLDRVGSDWLSTHGYLTGELFGYVEDSGSSSTDIRTKSRLRYYPPAAAEPTLELEYPVKVFFDHDYSTLEKERQKLAGQLASNLAQKFLQSLTKR